MNQVQLYVQNVNLNFTYQVKFVNKELMNKLKIV